MRRDPVENRLRPVYNCKHPEFGSAESKAKAKREAAQYVARCPQDRAIIEKALTAFYGVSLDDEVPF